MLLTIEQNTQTTISPFGQSIGSCIISECDYFYDCLFLLVWMKNIVTSLKHVALFTVLFLVDIVNYIHVFIWTNCELFIHLRHNMMFAFTSWNNYLLIYYFVFVCRIYGWSFMQRNTRITEILKNCITHVYSHFCRFNRLIIIKKHNCYFRCVAINKSY